MRRDRAGGPRSNRRQRGFDDLAGDRGADAVNQGHLDRPGRVERCDAGVRDLDGDGGVIAGDGGRGLRRLEGVAHRGVCFLGALHVIALVSNRECLLVDEPGGVRGLDRAHHVEVAALGALGLGSRAVEGLGEDARLQRRVDLAADRGALPRVRLVLVLHVGHEVPVDVIQRGIREGVVVVTHVVFLRRRCGESVLHEGRIESLVPRRDELGPELVRRHPVLALGVIGALLAVHRPRVVLSPESDEACGDVADAGVAVVLLAQGVHEVQEHLLDRRVVVVGGEGDVVVVENRVGPRRVDASVDEVLGDAGGARGVVEIEADRRLIASSGDGVQERIDLREVVGVAPGHDRVDGEVGPLHRVGE